MDLRPLRAEDPERMADYLQPRTRILRWLVAFLRNWDLFPPTEASRWSFWCGEREGEVQCVLAQFFRTGTLYVSGSPGADLAAIEALCREELLPERVIGDEPVVERWLEASEMLAAGARRVSRLDVLEYEGPGEIPVGFRPGAPEDVPVLREYERLLCEEAEEKEPADVESLIGAGLVFVVEENGEIEGMVHSNLSDGRYVHAGGVFVHPRFRAKGVARSLAAGLGAVVRRDQKATVVLDVHRQNEFATRAYESAGYRKNGCGIELRLKPDIWPRGAKPWPESIPVEERPGP